MMKPMLAEIGSTETLQQNYLFEPKLDGIRLLVKKNKKFQMFNRHGKEVTSKYSHLDLAPAFLRPATVDGELVVYGENGNPDFSLMQKSQSNKSIIPTYVVFDILEVNGRDVQSEPLISRKKLLKTVVKPTKHVQLMIYTSQGRKLWKLMEKRKGEGVVAKQIFSPYLQRRSAFWLKIKTTKTVDAVIIGYSKKKRSFAMGLKDREWIHIGNVGTGLTEEDYRELIKELIPQEKTLVLPPFTQQVKPHLVCEIEFLQVTKDQKLRAPVFLHRRFDKKTEECTFAQLLKIK